jgi:dipeptidyl aminopeptidase/acylaminoacyl peptidase
VAPLHHAYLDWCGRDDWNGKKHDASGFTGECAQWRVVTDGGHTFRVPEALGIYTEQSNENTMNGNGPLSISAEGRRIVYYSEKDRRFAVRDLMSGEVWTIPVDVTRASLVKDPPTVRISPQGRYAAVDVRSAGPRVLVDVERQSILRSIPGGWFPLSVTDDGTMVTEHIGGSYQLRLMSPTSEGETATLGKEADTASYLSPDGHTIAYFERYPENKDPRKQVRAIITIDMASGGAQVAKVNLRGGPKGSISTRIGPWLNTSEVVVFRDLAPLWGPGIKVPTIRQATVAVNVETGVVRELATYEIKAFRTDLSAPGF